MAGDVMADLERAKRMMAIDARLVQLMPRIMPGLASEEVAREFLEVRRDYEALLRETLPADSLVSVADVRRRLAEAVEYAARTYASMRAMGREAELLAEAAQAYRRAGLPAEAERCERSAAQTRAVEGSDFDAEIDTLQRDLRAGFDDPLDEIECRIALGDATQRAGDDFGSLEHYERARELLHQNFGEKDDPSDVFAALASMARTVGSEDRGSEPLPTDRIVRGVRLRGLRKRLLRGLMQAHADLDPEKAAGYERELRDMDAPLMEQDVAQKLAGMLKTLGG